MKTFHPQPSPKPHYIQTVLHLLDPLLPTRAVLEDTQQKWNPIPPIPDSRIPAYTSPLPEAADIQLAQALVSNALLPADVAAAIVVHARAGHVSYDANILTHRIAELRTLVPKFPGLDLHATLSREPAVLNHRSTAAAFQRHLTMFQDAYPKSSVGELLPSLGRFIIRNPRGLAEKLKMLDTAFPEKLKRPFPLLRLSSTCTFLSMKPEAIAEHLSAFVSIFGEEGAAAILVDGEIGVMSYAPTHVNALVQVLRQTFKDSPLASVPVIDPSAVADESPTSSETFAAETTTMPASTRVGGGRVNESIVSGFVTQLVAAHPVAVLSLSASADAFASRRQWLQFVTGLDVEGLKRAVLQHPLLLGVHDYEIDERSKALAEAHGFPSVQEGMELFATRPELLLQPLAPMEST